MNTRNNRGYRADTLLVRVRLTWFQTIVRVNWITVHKKKSEFLIFDHVTNYTSCIIFQRWTSLYRPIKPPGKSSMETTMEQSNLSRKRGRTQNVSCPGTVQMMTSWIVRHHWVASSTNFSHHRRPLPSLRPPLPLVLHNTSSLMYRSFGILS